MRMHAIVPINLRLVALSLLAASSFIYVLAEQLSTLVGNCKPAVVLGMNVICQQEIELNINFQSNFVKQQSEFV